MKVKVDYSKGGYYHIYLDKENMKCTESKEETEKIINTLIKMFGTKIEVDYFGTSCCPYCNGVGKVCL